MKIIEDNKEWNELVKNSEPDPDFSMDEYVCEDFWDEKHDKVIACIKYYNDGTIVRYATTESP